MASFAITLAPRHTIAGLRHVRTYVSPAPAAGDDFGYRVLAVDGGARLLVSAPLDPVGAFGSGAAYLFDAVTGAVVRSYPNPTPAEVDAFGFSACVVGSHVAIGAILDDTAGENAGAVYVFSAATGLLERTIFRSPALEHAGFGWSLAALGDDLLIGTYEGGAVFRVDPSTGAILGTYEDPDPEPGEKSFGAALAVHGSLVLVAQPEGPGPAFVFDGESGSLLRLLPAPGGGFNGLGAAMGVGNGEAWLGAPIGSVEGVAVYDVTAGTLLRTLPSPFPAVDQGFGAALGPLGNDRIVVGAPGDGGVGATFVFDRASGVVAETLLHPDPAGPAGFGVSLAVAQGSVFVGTGGEHTTRSGAVYLFTACGDGLVQPGESCDDGNTADGDGCSATCQLESESTTTTSTTSSTTGVSSSSTSTTRPNRAPLALAGRPQLAAVGATVEFDGSSSFDPDGPTVGFQWSIESAPAGSSASLTGAGSVRSSLVPDLAGAYIVRLVVDDGQVESAPATVSVTVTEMGPGIELSITSPADGAHLSSSEVLVEGTVLGPPNTGVSVNGVVAVVEGNRFTANAVPLLAGSNMLRAVASVLAGDAASATVSVTSDAGVVPLSIRAVPASGVAPLPVRFELRRSSTAVIDSLAVDFDGDGTDDMVAPGPADTFEHVYSVPGLYLVRATETDVNGVATVAHVAVAVADEASVDGMFKGLWSDMNAALVAGNRVAASRFVTEGALAKYGPVWEALAPHMTDIVASYSPIHGLSITSHVAEYGLNRTVGGDTRIFLLYFVKGADGVWRLDAM